MRYRCDICGCYLDPGEGRTCDECRSDRARRERQARQLREMVYLEGNQYTMRGDIGNESL